jgi:glycosyltransferase involved in cell wall biosynthesis
MSAPTDAPASAPARLGVLIVAEHASARFGGEAILPLHYFRILRERGIPAWLVVHERTRDELLALFPAEQPRMRFIRDTWLHRALWRSGAPLPRRLREATLGYALRLLTQLRARAEARRLIERERIDVVHQPIPVSPREPSALFGLGVPVVIGPMNGAMQYPAAFRAIESRWSRALVRLLAGGAAGLHRLLPGKLRAATLLVANPRTRAALPRGSAGRVVEMTENGVDLGLWQKPPSPAADPCPCFVFLGRLEDWKAVDLLLHALQRAAARAPARLEIIGDGPMRVAWTALAEQLGLASRVRFLGWLPQHEAAERLRAAHALVLPSLYECGGAVVLEAMASGLPVVATRWGGPCDYLDEDCGILVEPSSRDALVGGLADAIARLAADPELRRRLGERGRERVIARYDWNRKVDEMLEIYREAALRGARPRAGTHG